MAVQEVVRILRQYNVDEGDTLRARSGPEAVTAALEMQRFLEARLEEDRLHFSLLRQFVEAPRDDAEELIGVLEALVEADPALARRLDAFVGEYNAALVRQTEAASAEGGGGAADKAVAAIGGDVLDTAASITEVSEEQGTGPYAPDSTTDTDFDKGAGSQSTYLYGNAPSGDDEVGRHVGTDRFGEGASSISPVVTATTYVSRLFEQLDQALSEHKGIDEGRKKEVAQLLDRIQDSVRLGEEGDPLLPVQHLELLQKLAPDISAILLEALGDDRSQMAPMVRRAVIAVQESTET